MCACVYEVNVSRYTVQYKVRSFTGVYHCVRMHHRCSRAARAYTGYVFCFIVRNILGRTQLRSHEDPDTPTKKNSQNNSAF